MSLLVKLLNENATAPTVARPGDIAYDLYASEDVFVQPNLGPFPALAPTLIPTGIAVAEQGRFGFFIKDRSSMALKGHFTHGGVIDVGYRGELKVIATSMWGWRIKKGDRVAQLVPIAACTGNVSVVDTLDETERGALGFGSTGK